MAYSLITSFAAMSAKCRSALDRLSSQRRALALEAIAAIAAATSDLDELPSLVSPWLRRLTRSDVLGYGEVDERTDQRRAMIDPLVPDFIRHREAYVRHRESHPFWGMDLAYFNQGPRRDQDAFPRGGFRRLPIYREVYRPAGVTAVMQTAWAVPGGRVGFGVHRLGGPSFSVEDRAAFAALQPYLQQARELARFRTLQNLDPAGRIALLYPQLSPRQQEVLRWIGEGKDNPTIAHLLAVSEQTIKEHLKLIYAAMGVQSRLEAAVSLYDVHGLHIPHARALLAAAPAARSGKNPGPGRRQALTPACARGGPCAGTAA